MEQGHAKWGVTLLAYVCLLMFACLCLFAYVPFCMTVSRLYVL